jgi:hypothetical protein
LGGSLRGWWIFPGLALSPSGESPGSFSPGMLRTPSRRVLIPPARGSVRLAGRVCPPCPVPDDPGMAYQPPVYARNGGLQTCFAPVPARPRSPTAGARAFQGGAMTAKDRRELVKFELWRSFCCKYYRYRVLNSLRCIVDSTRST